MPISQYQLHRCDMQDNYIARVTRLRGIIPIHANPYLQYRDVGYSGPSTQSNVPSRRHRGHSRRRHPPLSYPDARSYGHLPPTPPPGLAPPTNGGFNFDSLLEMVDDVVHSENEETILKEEGQDLRREDVGLSIPMEKVDLMMGSGMVDGDQKASDTTSTIGDGDPDLIDLDDLVTEETQSWSMELGSLRLDETAKKGEAKAMTEEGSIAQPSPEGVQEPEQPHV
ncbi:hypothetical protein EJ08DRAFT_657683 [Tothia fuscella]|uniref:Uncharacterized protein n=1 Tax=Tothia fuscella TaxID=1048955 RepID=A0A9P4U0V1_9PEZI|nr:hypothetical protein EJ08DRAFT_657683 [Tothia fuscella]